MATCFFVMYSDELKQKIVFIFREKDNQLLISNNGRIEKGNWEYLGNNSLLIDRTDGSYLFKHGFIDNYVLALKVDGKDEYALLVNEQKFDNQLNSLPSVLKFLNDTYIEQKRNEILTIPKTPVEIKIERPIPKPRIQPRKIKESFSPNLFPSLVKDIGLIKEKLNGVNNTYAIEIIMSFVRDHSIKNEWAKENPEVTELVVNKKIPIGVIEQLFKRSKDNFSFRKDLEEYLIDKLNK